MYVCMYVCIKDCHGMPVCIPQKTEVSERYLRAEIEHCNVYLYIFCHMCLSVCMSVDCPADFMYLPSVNGGCYKVV